MKLTWAQTTRQCQLEEVADGQTINCQTRQTSTYSDPGVERGMTIAYNPQAHTDVRKALRELLTAMLKPK